MAEMRGSRGPVRLRSKSYVEVQAAPPTSRVLASQIPIYVCNRNRFTSTKTLVDWILKAGTQKVVILDNASSYPPLLEYYDHLPNEVSLKRQENLGPWSFWEQGMHLTQSASYIVTDSDIIPSECCPLDLVERLQELLLSTPGCGKVGPGLRLDNIPDLSREFITHGDGKGWEGEGVFWQRRHSSGAFNAPLDTTFAIYGAFSPWVPADWNNLRMDFPYVAEHMPWYLSKPFSDEENYYREHADRTWSHVTWPSPINDA